MCISYFSILNLMYECLNIFVSILIAFKDLHWVRFQDRAYVVLAQLDFTPLENHIMKCHTSAHS